MKTFDKAPVIACAGKSLQSLTGTGEKKAMETVMLEESRAYRLGIEF